METQLAAHSSQMGEARNSKLAGAFVGRTALLGFPNPRGT